MTAHESESVLNNPVVNTNGLRFSYGDHDVLHNVALAAYHGEVVGLLGANGSGKSTLLRCLAGLLPVPRSTVTLAGRDLRSMKRKQIASMVSFLPQVHETLEFLTVGELVARGRHPHTAFGWRLSSHDRDAVASALSYVQLDTLRHRPINEISGGERQRAWIAMVLAQDTPLMLLDEPVTYLDIKHQWSLLEVLTDLSRNLGKTLITVFHDINHAMAVCDRVYLLAEGRVSVSGRPEEVITSDALRHAYGVSAHVCHVRQACRSVVVPECSCRARLGGAQPVWKAKPVNRHQYHTQVEEKDEFSSV
ncbi:MAG: ABC transporter ATP-binding protein [Spirochaetaceae bacterium]